MALKDLVYLCPFCGHDPTEGRRDHAHCPGCERHYRRGATPALIDVVGPGGAAAIPAHELVDRLAAWGPGGTGPDGGEEVARAPDPRRRVARVKVRRATAEEPIHLRDRILGFVERLGRPVEMRLALGRTALELHGENDVRRCWNLMDLRALQASSSSLQVYTRAEELVHFRFLEDSAFRWEALLQEALREAYRSVGKGEIVEFQPRIVVR